MKVLIVGNLFPGCLEASYERAFKAEGCDAKILDTGGLNRFLRNIYTEGIINKRLARACSDFKPDLLFIIKGFYLWPGTLKKIKEAGKGLIFCFNTDNPFNLASCATSNRNIINALPHYDCYFIWSKLLIEPLLKNGATRAEYLPFGYDYVLHHPVALSDTQMSLYGNDIVFVGNWDEERERWLSGLSDYDLGLWGSSYWARRCKDMQLRRKWRGRRAVGDVMSCVLNASKISLNIFRIQNKGAHNMRTFEAPACGAFVLAERSPEAKEFFEEGKEAAYFSSSEELGEKIKYYLAHDEERKRIAKAGYEHCLKSAYSYQDRARQILKVYAEISG